MARTLPEPFAGWFAAQGWAPRRHQLAMLAAARDGESVLLIAPTGGGKTLAGFLPTLVELAEAPRAGIHTLYVSPLKALAADIARNLMRPVSELSLNISIDTSGDTMPIAIHHGRSGERAQRGWGQPIASKGETLGYQARGGSVTPPAP